MELQGQSLIGFDVSSRKGQPFWAVDPATAETINPEFHAADAHEVELAATLAQQAFRPYSRWSGKQKAGLLVRIAAAIETLGQELIDRTALETALPHDRLRSELARTCNQLRLFAALVEEGSWVNARIDRADARRKPLPKPDVRSVLRPLGPIAIFGASNFPLAFSVAGGDTASALAAGNPVVVKAHPAHPGTSELVGRAVVEALAQAGAPNGVFSLLFDSGTEVGRVLVQHPAIKAGCFTGSRAGGRALMDLAASRPDPIPFFAEMSSVNPIFVLPRAIDERAEQIAAGLYGSVGLGAGQFCTKPGLILLEQGAGAERLSSKLGELVSASVDHVLLTSGIHKSYKSGVAQRANLRQVASVTRDRSGFRAAAILFETDLDSLASNAEFAAELFGPSTTIARYDNRDQLLRFAEGLEGHLTATIHGTEEDLSEFADLVEILEGKVGRLVFNGYPTGVEVCHAMVHGGPCPATSDARFTSVGTQAILRFVRPVCFQDFPDAALPPELRNGNPLGIWRMVDGQLFRDALT